MENEQKGIKKHMLSFLKNLWLFLLLIPLVLLAFTGTVAAGVAYNEFLIYFELQGDSAIEVEYGTEFTEPGVQAYVSGTVILPTPQKIDVTTSGFVDTKIIGTYSLAYHAEFGGTEKTAIRTVYVVDTKPPVITLVSNPDAYTLPGQPYAEEGFSAYDEYDGDVTDRVVRVEKNGVVSYSVKDSSGNLAQVSREIVYDERVAPELTLQGSSVMLIYVGTAYSEAGCTAMDNFSGDITDRITITGTVDTNTVGSYVLTYRAEDDYGNVGEVRRIVHVAQYPSAERVVYLTFDDGPSVYTNRLLDILKKYDAKATFFLVNTGSIATVQRIVAEGHAVGIHSISHDYDKIYASEDAFMSDLYGMQKIIRDQTGVTTYLMRFPGGSSNKVSSFNPGIMSKLVNRVKAEGFQYFDWNVGSSDTSRLGAEKISANVIQGISKTSKAVVLQHDIYQDSVEAVEYILQWGLLNGYTFKALDHSSPTAQHKVNN